MQTMRQAANEFLAGERIAVAGVSREEGQTANAIYRHLRDHGYQVIPVNPNADEVEGDPCYRSIGAIPDTPDGVLIVTPPEAAPGVARDCVDAGVRRVWMHRSFGPGSVSAEATEICRRAGIAVLDGGCPLMFLEPVDIAHRCMRWILGRTGKLPAGTDYTVPSSQNRA